MLLGAHVSIAGGIIKAPKNAATLGCEVFQMFTRSPQGGPAQKLTPEIIKDFLVACKENQQKEWVVHTPYYINLASPTEKTRKNSVRIIREELERASLIQATYVMAHMGSSKGISKKQGLGYVIKGIKEILDGYKGSAQFLIEISAGAGEVIGDTFEEIAYILDHVSNEVGVCFDTQHAFGSGYDLRTKDAVANTFDQFDKIIGLDKLKMSHCNDSKVALGDHKDRHEHIGKGHIGLPGFKAIIGEKRLGKVNLYLETEPDEQKSDLELLKTIRG